MCGVSGFWAPTVEAEVARRMALAIAYRGPDGDGLWSSREAGVAFSHRRLAIIDVSDAGLQPMTSASGRFVITFNGEVYNFATLRDRLEREGHAPAWHGGSDTEVMLAAIEAWGLERAVSQFIGMFAFALFDTVERRLHLVRDRLGVKPLFITRNRRGLAFASEAKALRVFPDFDTSIDHDVLAGYLAANCVAGERSIFQGTRHVRPGTIVTFEGHDAQPKTTCYWDPWEVVQASLRDPFQGTAEEAISELDTLLRDAVRLRMVSDVPLGAFLSGGIDSSTVVGMMQAQSHRPVHTFSIANEKASWDESTASRAVARHLNTHHTPFTVTPKDALEIIPLLPAMYDEPFADSSQIPTYLVSRLARRDVTVALSGDGGDELFGGYTRHLWGPRIWRAHRVVPSWLRRRLGDAISALSPAWWDNFFQRGEPFVPRTRIAGIRMHKLAAVLDARSHERMYQVLSSHWLPEDQVLREPASSTPAHQAPDFDDVASAMMYQDLTGYLPDDILTKVDRASMAVSLEAREPLIDHRVVAFAWRLPNEFKIRGGVGKWILRQVLSKYVPLDIVSGPKTGFGVPLGDWLRGPLRDWAESLISEERLRREGLFNAAVIRSRWDEHLKGIRPWEYHLWDILMFQAWGEAHHISR
jgi:asparagine synthase (glutamine-hydrolysing)